MVIHFIRSWDRLIFIIIRYFYIVSAPKAVFNDFISQVDHQIVALFSATNFISYIKELFQLHDATIKSHLMI